MKGRGSFCAVRMISCQN